MANNKSAKKRIRITKRNNLENRFYKSSVKTVTKRFLKYIEIFKTDRHSDNRLQIYKDMCLLFSLIDKGVKKNIYHRNTASRKKAEISALIKQNNAFVYAGPSGECAY
jgi:small subunit ribosomal protein S20